MIRSLSDPAMQKEDVRFFFGGGRACYRRDKVGVTISSSGMHIFDS